MSSEILETSLTPSLDNEMKDTPELEWKRQSGNYIALGFHKELGVTENGYLNSLPRFSQNSDLNQQLDLTLPLLVDPRIKIRRQIELAGISIPDKDKDMYENYSLQVRNMFNFFDLPEPERTDIFNERRKQVRDVPYMPYIVWTHEGTKFSGNSFYSGCRKLAEEFYSGNSFEKIGTIGEGIAYAIQYPLRLQSRELMIMGTEIGADAQTPGLFKDKDELFLFFGRSLPSNFEDRSSLSVSWPPRYKKEQ